MLFGHFGQPSSLVAFAELTAHGCSTSGCSRSGVVELVFLLVNRRTNGWLSASAIKLEPLNAFSSKNAILDCPLHTHTARATGPEEKGSGRVPSDTNVPEKCARKQEVTQTDRLRRARQ